MKTLRTAGLVALCTVIALGVTSMMGSRNTGGTYSFPMGTYPVVSGTQIQSTWANNIFGDIQTTLSASLDRYGNGPMLAPLRVPDGTVTAPTFAFSNETGTGLYRIGAADTALSVNGTKRQEWTSTGTSITGTASADSVSAIGNIASSAGKLSSAGDVIVDSGGANSGTISGAVRFGSSSAGEGIGSKRTATGNQYGLDFYTSSTVRLSIANTGALDAHSNAINNVATPSASTDAATKGYVDTAVGSGSLSDGASSIVNGSGWTKQAWTTLRKQANGVVCLSLASSDTGGSGGATVATLPVGYRPSSTVGGGGWNFNSGSLGFTIGTDGVIALSPTSYPAGSVAYLSICFPTT